MSIYISLLRGVNVSGHRKIRMTELRALYERFGYRSVRTYLQSGNIVFSDREGGSDHAITIQTAIYSEFGHKVLVLVIPEATFVGIVDSNPLVRRTDIDESFLHVTFLFEPPRMSFPRSSLPRSENESVVFHKGHLYLYCPNGYGRTKINNNYFEKLLKVPATTRNWKTVNALKALTRE